MPKTLKKPAVTAAPAAPAAPIAPEPNLWDRPEWIAAFKGHQQALFEPARQDIEVALKKARCTATEYYTVLARVDALTADACDAFADAVVPLMLAAKR